MAEVVVQCCKQSHRISVSVLKQMVIIALAGPQHHFNTTVQTLLVDSCCHSMTTQVCTTFFLWMYNYTNNHQNSLTKMNKTNNS